MKTRWTMIAGLVGLCGSALAASLPSVTTPSHRSSSATTAGLGGNVTSDGGATLTTRGVVYALTAINSNPKVGGTGVSSVPHGQADIGVFSVAVSGLTPDAAYSFAAYAANSVGTGYSATGSFISTPFTYTSTAGAVTITGYNGGDSAVTIPATIGGQPVTRIGDSAFALAYGWMTSITLPDSVTSIGYSAFWQCEALTSINIPSCITNIGDMAFADCPSLTSITIPSGVASIGYNTFNGCRSLSSVTIPSSVDSIRESAFAGCASLQSITIPSGVTSIGNQAFADCTGLTSITISSNVASIGDSVFSACTGLTSISLPSGLTSLGGLMFYGCTGLTSVTIPASVTGIGYAAFADCTGLTSASFLGDAPDLGDGVTFNGTDPGFTVYYQSGAKDFTSPFWNDYPAVAMQTLATVMLSNLTQTYDNTAKTVSVVTLPTNLAVSVTYNGSTSAPTNAGSYTVIGTISDVNYVGSATNTLEIGKATQSITFGTLPVMVYGDAPFALTASASSGLPVSYDSADKAVATVSGSTVSILKAGSTLLTASQVGDVNYLAATNVSQNLVVDELMNGLNIRMESKGSMDGLETITNTVILTITGNPGREYAVCYNNALTHTNWSVLTTITNLPSSPYLFTDPAPELQPTRFYRLLRSIWTPPDN